MNLRISALLFVALAACARASTAGAADNGAATISSGYRINAKPIWISKPLPELASIVAAGEDVVFSTVSGGIGVVDTRNGAIEWQRTDASAKSTAVRDAIFAADGDGEVSRFRLSDGSVQWRAQICPVALSRRQFHGVELAGAIGDDLYARVICRSSVGRLIRIDANSGSVRATSGELAVDGIQPVRDLGYGVIAVSAWSGGASSNSPLFILRRGDLSPYALIPHTDTTVVGTIAGTAILDDWCCLGRMEDYDPATILRLDLRTGTMDAPIDLRPFPEKLGKQVSVYYPALAGNDLWIGIPPMLIDYGDARAPLLTPVTVLDTLLWPPEFIEHGRALLSVRDANGSLVDELVDLNVRPPRTLWQADEASTRPVVIYRPEQSPGIVGLTWGPKRPSALIRTMDGAAIVGACARQVVMIGDAIVAQCEHREIVDRRFIKLETHLERYQFAKDDDM